MMTTALPQRLADLSETTSVLFRGSQGVCHLGHGSGFSLQIAGFWREVGVASSQNLALKTPKRLEALFLTLSGHELIVKAAYNR